MSDRCSCLTCREFGRVYQGRVLFLATREGEDLHVGVDELTEDELAHYTVAGTEAEKAEIVDWLSTPAPMASECPDVEAAPRAA